MKRALMLLAIMVTITMMAAACCPKCGTRPPQPPIPPPPELVTEKPVEPEPEVPEKPATVAELKPVYFDFDKFEIRAGEVKVMDDNAQYMQEHAGMKFTLEGYCDPMGTEEYNRGLGLRRATATKDWLVKKGIEASRLSVVSFGKEKLVTKNPAEFELNRRVEFKGH